MRPRDHGARRGEGLRGRRSDPRGPLLTHQLLPALRRAPRGYQHEVAYKNSKLAMMWLTYELARRLEHTAITVNAVCPGFVPATAAQSVHGAMRLLLKYVMPLMPFATTIDRATDTFAYACLDPAMDGVRGKFIADREPIASSRDSYDLEKQARFWNWACKAVGIPTDWF